MAAGDTTFVGFDSTTKCNLEYWNVTTNGGVASGTSVMTYSGVVVALPPVSLARRRNRNLVCEIGGVMKRCSNGKLPSVTTT